MSNSREHVVVEELLDLLIGQVDTKLLKRVVLRNRVLKNMILTQERHLFTQGKIV